MEDLAHPLRSSDVVTLQSRPEDPLSLENHVKGALVWLTCPLSSSKGRVSSSSWNIWRRWRKQPVATCTLTDVAKNMWPRTCQTIMLHTTEQHRYGTAPASRVTASVAAPSE
jgi:hypothetical protein